MVIENFKATLACPGRAGSKLHEDKNARGD